MSLKLRFYEFKFYKMSLSVLVKYLTVEEKFQGLKELKQGSAKKCLLRFYFHFENFGAVFMIDLEGKCYFDGVMTGLGSPSQPCKWGLALANPNPGLACQGLPCLTLTLTQVLAVFSCRGPR